MSKAEAGEVKWSKSKLIKSKSTLKFLKVARMTLGRSLKKFTTLVPHLSELVKNGPLKYILKKSQSQPFMFWEEV